jgi:hypothetical protein
MQMSVLADTKQLTKHLNRIQKKQIPFATSKALNDVAFDSRSFIQKSLPRRLDRPTKGIISSVQVEKSKKKNLVARVGFAGLGFKSTKWSESPAEIMLRQIKGGTRSPQGKAIPVPIVNNLKLNKFGNMPRTKIKTLLAKSDKYFSGQPKGRDAGIYERTKRTKRKPGKLKMLINWETTTQYQGGRFPLQKIVELAVKKKYRVRFDAALNNALRSAR